MANVNPPPQLRTPNELQKTNDSRVFFERINTILFQLWTRTGGPTDGLEELNDFILNVESQLTEFDDLESLYGEKNKPFVSIQTSDYETSLSEVVVCDSNITVTLNEYPKDRESVTVKIRNGDVVIDGNGKLVDGESSIQFIASKLQGQPTVDLIYLLESDDWIIV